MPDFFLGKPLSHSSYPPDTEEKKKELGAFFAGPAEPGKTSKMVGELVKKLGGTTEGKGVEKWGSLGMCWGGKVGLSLFWSWWVFGEVDADGGIDCFLDSPIRYALLCGRGGPSCYGRS